VLVIVVVLVRRARRVNRRRAAARDTANRMAQPHDPFKQDHIGGDPRELKLGDLVVWPGTSDSHAVRGTMKLTEDGYSWWEHFIDPVRGAKRYLSVDPSDGDLEVVVWTEVDDFDIKPGQRQVAHDGVAYKLKEQGTASYTGTGTLNVPSRGQVQYMDYRGQHGRRLSFERFNNGKWELSIGEVIADSQLTIYPSS
jgi:hypothetical protein